MNIIYKPTRLIKCKKNHYIYTLLCISKIKIIPMEKVSKKELEEKIRNPKKFKVVTIKTSYIKLEENFNDVFNEIEEVIDNNSDIFSSYDISQSIDDITMSPMIYIFLHKENKINKEKIIKSSPIMLCNWCFKEKCSGHNIFHKIINWFKK